METWILTGRPDGIGNRIEEIIRLEAACNKKNKEGKYLWINKINNRSYPIHFSSKRVDIKKSENQNNTINNSIVKKAFDSLSQEEILFAAQAIKPSFNITFKNGARPIGIHIRGTDRIGRNHPHFMKDKKELQNYLNSTLYFVNQEKPKHVFICSDNDNYKQLIIEKLHQDIEIINPICDEQVGGVYQDFFALTLCSKLYMTSKFSSFSITASLIGKIPIVCFYKDLAIQKRFKALFVYKPIDAYKNKLKSKIELKQSLGDHLKKFYNAMLNR